VIVKTNLLFFIIFCLLSSCDSLKHTTQVKKTLPELGTIGVYETYLLGTNYQPKTILSISEPVKVHLEKIKIEQRQVFIKKDSIQQPKQDSTHVTLEILDKLRVINEINTNPTLLSYLMETNQNRLVSQVRITFPESILSQLLAAEEIYLIQNRQKTLSLELRSGNRKTGQVEFSEGTIVSFQTSEFCWGQNERRKIVVFDVVPKGSQCSETSYKSVKIVKKKNKFKF
tara:strand:- start:117 stop:800 length:684 start_codon:yes stop_codon:yes gene_type:complete